MRSLVYLLVAAVALSAGCTKKATMPTEEDGRTLADTFMEMVRTGKAAQAWEGTSTEFKSAEGKESFVRSVKKRPWLTKKATFETTTILPAGTTGERAEYVYRSADSKHHVRLLVASANTGWCIDRIQID
ncbi:MAG TPA: hypothetical protein VGN12_08195 [Pirellulales bacterium]|jgi:hypothetical protein